MRLRNGNGGGEGMGRSPVLGRQATFQAHKEAKGLGPWVLGAATAEQALLAPSPKSCLPLTKPKNK